MGASFDALGSRSTCNGKSGAGFMFLKLFANTASVVGACGDLDAPDGTNFSASGMSTLTIGRDRESLEAELELERRAARP